MNSEPSCKLCLHEASFHAENMDFLNKNLFKFIGIPGCTVGPWCQCKKFIIEDNLKYLEWKDKQNDRV